MTDIHNRKNYSVLSKKLDLVDPDRSKRDSAAKRLKIEIKEYKGEK